MALGIGLAMFSCATDPTTGYAFGSGHRADVKSVSVPIWENRTSSPTLGAQLTEAIIKEIQRSTPWLVVDSGATTTLSGVVVEQRLRKLDQDSTTGLVQEQGVDLAVDFHWRNNRSRKEVLTRRNFRAQGDFIPTRGVGEPIEIGQFGAIQALARDIVAELRSDW